MCVLEEGEMGVHGSRVCHPHFPPSRSALLAAVGASMLPPSPVFDLASDASSVLRAAAADAAEARRLAQMARQTSELVLRQAAQARSIDRIYRTFVSGL